MLWEGDDSLLERWIPVPAGGMSLALLHCSKTVMMMSFSATHTGLPAPKPSHKQVGTARPFPGWRFPSTGTLAGALCRIAVPPPVQSLLGDTCPGTHRPQAPGPHGPPGRCPSPAHPAAEFTGKKQRQFSQCQLCQRCPGQQPCPCGVTWPHPMVTHPVHAGRALRR